MTIHWHQNPDFAWRPGIAFDVLDEHLAACHMPSHGAYIMGVYDPYGMRINRTVTVTCCADEGRDLNRELDDCAREQVPQWPGQQVCLWLDLNLAPAEHLRDMPTPDAHAGVQLRRSA